MPLPPPAAPRTLTHTRRIRFEGYRRTDGLWDLEAHLEDVKPQDYLLSSGIRAAGMPVHDLSVRPGWRLLPSARLVVEVPAEFIPVLQQSVAMIRRTPAGLQLQPG